MSQLNKESGVPIEQGVSAEQGVWGPYRTRDISRTRSQDFLLNWGLIRIRVSGVNIEQFVSAEKGVMGPY